MKKTLIAAAAAVALTASAAAEITFGSWGCAIAVPVANNGKDTVAGQTMSWGGYGRTTGLTFRGDSDGVAGFVMDVRATTKGVLDNPGDAHFWVKPVDQVKLAIGLRDFNPLRSNIGLAAWDWIRPSFTADDGVTFDCSTFSTGLTLEVTPVDGFYAYVQIPLCSYDTTKTYWDTSSVNAFDKAEDVYKRVTAAAAYTIDGVGQVKVGYTGAGYNKDAAGNEYKGQLQAAFNLTAVENLALNVGVKYAMVDKDYDDFTDTEIGLEAAYQVNEAFRIAANATAFIATTKSDAIDSVDPKFRVGAAASYVLADGLTAVVDGRFATERKVKGSGVEATEESKAAFLVGINKQIGAATLGLGFQMETNVFGGESGLKGIENSDTDTTKKSTQWAIPLIISAAF